MKLLILLVTSFLFLGLCLGQAAPDRMRFAMEDRPIEGVPVEAFELLDDNLTIELLRPVPRSFIPRWLWILMLKVGFG